MWRRETTTLPRKWGQRHNKSCRTMESRDLSLFHTTSTHVMWTATEQARSQRGSTAIRAGITAVELEQRGVWFCVMLVNKTRDDLVCSTFRTKSAYIWHFLAQFTQYTFTRPLIGPCPAENWGNTRDISRQFHGHFSSTTNRLARTTMKDKPQYTVYAANGHVGAGTG